MILKTYYRGIHNFDKTFYFCFPDSTSCGSPEQPLSSQVEREGGVVRYSCERGFIMEGDRERRCRRDGYWSGEPPHCRGTVLQNGRQLFLKYQLFVAEVECTDPISPTNGYIEVSNFKGRYQFGSIAKYRCNPGFTLQGNESR